MIAALPWYPAARPTLDRLWRDVRSALGMGPAELSWPEDCTKHWQADDILLTQTCAPVWQRHLRGRLHVVGTLDFGVADPGFYRSALVTRLDDDRPLEQVAAHVAVNDFDSQSGWGALAAFRIGKATATGSHSASMTLVAKGLADLAAIDAVTWRLAPHPLLRVREWTNPTPAPPLLTAHADLIAPLREALAGAIADLSPAEKRQTGLRGMVPLDAASYASLPLPPTAPRCNRPEIAA